MQNPFKFSALLPTAVDGRPGGMGSLWPLIRRDTILSASFLLFLTFAAVMRADDVYLVSQRNGTVTKFNSTNGAASVFASGLTNPSALAFDGNGNLYVTNNENSIVKITPDGTQSVFATGLGGPQGLAFDGAGNLYVSDQFNNRIVKFTPEGVASIFSTVRQPRGIAFDSEGVLYVVSDSNIVKVTSSASSVFANPAPGFPYGIAFDKTGNLFTGAISESDWIEEYTPQGTGSVFLSSGLVNPYSLAFDSAGNLYIANFGQFDSHGNSVNSSITKVTPNGAFQFAGPPQTSTPLGIAIWPGLLPVKPTTPPTGKLLNIATRLRVQTGENVLIGGFIVTGNAAKKVMLRAIGPSLANAGITSFLPDPTLELRDSNATLIASNDNWKINDQTQQSQEAEIQATTIPPSNDLESALVAVLNQNQGYTAIVRGKGNNTGVAVIEAYDLDQAADSVLANISTRGFVDTGTSVMIGGFILGGGNGNGKVLVRAIGPSLSQSGVSNPVGDPVLELYNANGIKQASNDNWKTNDQSGQSQEAVIRATTVPPSNDLESAILVTLPAGNYTAIVSGKNGGTGVGLVEAYNLR